MGPVFAENLHNGSGKIDGPAALGGLCVACDELSAFSFELASDRHSSPSQVEVFPLEPKGFPTTEARSQHEDVEGFVTMVVE
jgi:hypothetical protein